MKPRLHSTKVAGWLILIALYAATGIPPHSARERAAMAKRFRLSVYALPAPAPPSTRTVRPVNPSLQRIASWISAVGAAAALGDIDGDGLPNDIVFVETRTDQVIVAPAPDKPPRFAPFPLDPRPLPYAPTTTAPTGALIGDFDEDGLADVAVYYWGRTPVLFLRKEKAPLGPAAFERRELMPSIERWYTNSALQADLDGDGHADLVFSNYFADGARILDADAPTRESMQSSMSTGFNGGRKAFLLWTRDGFREVETRLPPEVVHAWTLATGAQDLDGDLLPELYFANDFGPDRLLHNESAPGRLRFRVCDSPITFMQGKSRALGHDSFKGMGVDFADLNDDAIPDLFVSNITTPYALHESNFLFVSQGDIRSLARGIAPYREESTRFNVPQSGWGWDARLADFDNDGVPEALQATGFVRGTVNRWPQLQELAMGGDPVLPDPDNWPVFQPGDDLSGHQHLPFFVQASDGRYCDIAPELGLDTPQVTRGLAIGDTDGDGRLDFVAAAQWEDSHFYRNLSPTTHPFLGLRLRLPVDGPPNRTRPAFGAQAEVRLPGGRILRAQVDGGNGHSGKRAPELHFGLGDCPPSATLPTTIRWRDGLGTVRSRSVALKPGWHTVVLEKGGAR